MRAGCCAANYTGADETRSSRAHRRVSPAAEPFPGTVLPFLPDVFSLCKRGHSDPRRAARDMARRRTDFEVPPVASRRCRPGAAAAAAAIALEEGEGARFDALPGRRPRRGGGIVDRAVRRKAGASVFLRVVDLEH